MSHSRSVKSAHYLKKRSGLPSLNRTLIFFWSAVFAIVANPGLTGLLANETNLEFEPLKSPQYAYEEPRNLARWHLGSTLLLVQDGVFRRIQIREVGQFDESVLLSDNSALTHKIEVGRHDYIIDLGGATSLSRFYLNNQTAAGSFQLLASDTLEDAQSRSWRSLSRKVEFESGVIPSASFEESHTTYLMIRMDITSPGKIGHFGAIGRRVEPSD